MSVDPEISDVFLRKIEARIGRENRRMVENLTAWAEVLGALGWNVAMAFPGGSPLLNYGAERWAAGISPSLMSWDEITARLIAVPPARELKHTPQLHVWADMELREVAEPKPSVPLTKRETEVFGWLREGKTGPEISIILSCGQRTVESHVAKIYGKLGVRRRTELIFQKGEAWS